MSDTTPSTTPLEAVIDTVDERTIEAFELLGNEIRLAILLALWESIDAGPPHSEPTVPFSELRRRVGMRHGRQFNYHLDKLVGRFVHRSDEGYTLTVSGKRILSTVMAGTVTDPPSFEDERIDAACLVCGSSTVVDYHDSVLTQRCPDCDGLVQSADEPTGIIATEYRPPVGLVNRTPQEFVQQGKTWHRHRRHAFIEGTCPECSGTVTTSVEVCADHDTRDGHGCDYCGRVHGAMANFVCDVCKAGMRTGVWNTILTETPVVAFFYEHGLDTTALEDELAYGVLYEAVEEVAVCSETPLELRVTVTLDGDRLTVRLDEATKVLEVTEQPDATA
jgi:DNA-binding transcriptional ArsR family regulator